MSKENLAGEMAYALTKRGFVDIVTARAAVDEALKSIELECDDTQACQSDSIDNKRQRIERFGEHSASVVPDGWKLPMPNSEYVSALKAITRNGNLRDYDDELANRLEELIEALSAPTPPCERTESACNMTTQKLSSNAGNQFYDYEVVGDDLVLTQAIQPAGHSGANATTHEVTPSSDVKPHTGTDKSACEGASLEANNGEAVGIVIESSPRGGYVAGPDDSSVYKETKHYKTTFYSLTELPEGTKLFTHPSNDAKDAARYRALRREVTRLSGRYSLRRCKDNGQMQWATHPDAVDEVADQALANGEGK